MLLGIGGELVIAGGLESIGRALGNVGTIQQLDLQSSGQVAERGKAQRLAVPGVVSENGFSQAGLRGEADERRLAVAIGFVPEMKATVVALEAGLDSYVSGVGS